MYVCMYVCIYMPRLAEAFVERFPGAMRDEDLDVAGGRGRGAGCACGLAGRAGIARPRRHVPALHLATAPPAGRRVVDVPPKRRLSQRLSLSGFNGKNAPALKAAPQQRNSVVPHAVEPVAAQVAPKDVGMHARLEEDLGAVDVAGAAEEGLVHEQLANLLAGPRDFVEQRVGVLPQGVFAQARALCAVQVLGAERDSHRREM